ncbi:MAG: DUF484 family protein [Azoarcus sp.]|nr:DUF484 family protein [Azoarcus sp.]
MNADDVVKFLREHPAFLSEHSDLLAVLTVPQSRSGKVISLTERQVQVLRAKVRELEQKLADLIRFGEQNDEISEKVHRLALLLLDAADTEAARRALIASMRDDFAVPHVALRVWAGDDEEEVDKSVRRYAASLGRPYCGAPVNADVLGWFGEMSPHVRSVALMPLRRGGHVVGLLALGSEENERFYNDMGTLYLERIGALASRALVPEVE